VLPMKDFNVIMEELDEVQKNSICNMIDTGIANKRLKQDLSKAMSITIKKFKNMQTIDLIKEIQRLPLTKRFYVVEETIKSIKKEEMNHQMELAANELYSDYVNDKDLTAFTSIDFENFYETK
jgi:hypothetical protein